MAARTSCSSAVGASARRCAEPGPVVRARWIGRAHVAGWMLAWGLGMLLGAWSAYLLGADPPAPGERPGIFLEAANIHQARGLAMDAALSHGWGIIERDPAHVVFETYLEEPAVPGPPEDTPPPFTLLRIRADFIRQPAGVNVYLFAQEVWFPRDSREWTADVTQLYRPNLRRALQSLRARWDNFRRDTDPALADDDALPLVRVEDQVDGQSVPPDEDGDPPLLDDGLDMLPSQAEPLDAGDPSEPGIDATTMPVPPEGPGRAAEPVGPADVGQWAYYAEQYAEQRGCALGDLGAILIDEDGLSEVHRVYCEDGTSMDVRCDSRNCALTY